MCGKYVWLIVIIAALLCGACSLEGGDGLGTTTRPDGKTYTVSFNANGGSGSTPVPQSAESGTYITLPNEGGLSNPGYVFGGWSTLSSGSGTKFASGSSYTVPNQDSVLYAFWNNNRESYTVSFDANGGSGAAPGSQTVQAGSTLALPGGNVLSRSGYTFSGWNTNASGGAVYRPGDTFTPTRNSVFFANWESAASVYTVSFNANGGNGTAPASQTATAGSSITLPSGNVLSRSGYGFSGWNTNAAGTGATYIPGERYTPAGNATLYAKWDVALPDHTVTFSANGGTGTAPVAQKAKAGSSITLPNGNNLSRSGYTFGGWNTNASGTGSNYNAGDSFAVSGNTTLYARWNTATASCIVTFNANGGSGSAPSAQTAKAGSNITLPNGNNLSRNGYTFGGWNANAAGTGTNYNAGDSYSVNSNVTLYARWNAATASYTVTFSANGGSGTAPSTQTAQAGSSITLPNGNGLTRSGYSFGGWNTNTGGTGTNYNVGDSYTVNGNVTLYAKWNSAGTSTPPGGGGSNVFTSVSALKAYLNTLPANTIDTPYTVALNVNPLPRMSNTDFSGKYVSFDLSNSGITTIREFAFSRCTSLTSISIPSSITSIEAGTFLECTSLTSITIPGTVTSIGNSAFYFCSSLTSITIPNSVTSIEWSAFQYCTSLRNVTIPNGVTSIRGDTFSNCTSLTSIIIPGSVTSIGKNAFAACYSLRNVTIPGSVTSIEGLAFQFCTGLLSVTFEGYISSFDKFAFYYGVGDLYSAYSAGGPGTYTRANSSSLVWTKR